MTQREETDNNFTKQESSTSDNNNAKNFNPSSSTTTSTTTTTSWSRLKDPRIVRVSRAFGGKDRHSKVCTVRGLRDRRVRLSVPTAIQLYDLQDRLGLNQPSKVVDWLLNAAKHEIDELPPLQIPQGCNFNPILLHETRAESHDHQSKSKYERKVEENQDGFENFQGSRQNPSSLMNSSSSIQYNPFVRWDASSLTLSHPPRSHGLMSSPHQQQQPEDWHNFGLVPSSSNHQVVVYQPAAGLMSAHQSYSFPAQIGGSNAEFDSKQLSFHHQISSPQLSSPVDHSSSTSQGVRPIYFNMTANLLPSQNNGETS